MPAPRRHAYPERHDELVRKQKKQKLTAAEKKELDELRADVRRKARRKHRADPKVAPAVPLPPPDEAPPAIEAAPVDRAFPGLEGLSRGEAAAPELPHVAPLEADEGGAGAAPPPEAVSQSIPSPPVALAVVNLDEEREEFLQTVRALLGEWADRLRAQGVEAPSPEAIELCARMWTRTAEKFGMLDLIGGKWGSLLGATVITGRTFGPPTMEAMRRANDPTRRRQSPPAGPGEQQPVAQAA